MFNKLLILAAIFSLASCSSVFKRNAANTLPQNDYVVEEEAMEEEVYEHVANEEAAEALNAQEEAIEEEIEVQDRVFFDYDSSELSVAAKEILDTQILWLKSDSSINITIEGHCDERGTREYNIALGDRRANAAKKYLVENGILTSRITTISYGKEHPVYFGSDEADLAKNRRSVTVTE